MKKGLKVVLEVFLLLMGVLLVLTFLAFSARSEIVPDIYVTSEHGKVALAVRGGYKWNSFSESVIADSIAPEDYVYQNDNTLLVTPGEIMTLKNSENPLDRHKFYQLEMKYYDKDGSETIIPTAENSTAYADMDYLEVEAPANEGTYVYHFRLSYYNKGEVAYGVKVVVSAEPNYEITDLIKYRNTSLKDVTSIQEVLNLLPYADYKEGLIVRTNSEPTELQINYKTLAVEKDDLINNTIALFILIPELNLITYQTENEVSVYTRSEIENQMGRKLSDYANDIELWKSEILFKEEKIDEKVSRETIYNKILTDILSRKETENNNILFLDTESFLNQELLPISSVDRQEVLEFAAGYGSVIYDMSKKEYEDLHLTDLMIGAASIKNRIKKVEKIIDNETSELEKEAVIEGETNFIPSGDIIEETEEGKYICTIFVFENGKSELIDYEVYFENEVWNVIKL